MGNNRPTNRPYDLIDNAEDFLPRQHIHCFGIVGTMTGTHAAAGTEIVQLFKVPANSNISITGVTAKRSVGGTAAATAPAWGVTKSLAGTGAASCFGTLLFGTAADNSWANFTVTETEAAAGDVIALRALTGTTSEESQIINNVTVEYKEDWD